VVVVLDNLLFHFKGAKVLRYYGAKVLEVLFCLSTLVP
jgi:hypothetical protein